MRVFGRLATLRLSEADGHCTCLTVHQWKKQAAACNRQDGWRIVACSTEAPTLTIGIIDFTIGAGVDGDHTGSTCTEGELCAVGWVLIVGTGHGTGRIKAECVVQRYRDAGLI